MKIYNYMTGPIQANTYLAFDETKKGFIVDPGGYDKAITDQIKTDNIELEYIILTHGHGDHIGGVEGFKQDFPNAKIIALKEEKEMLNNPSINVSGEICGHDISMDADIYVNDGDEMTIGNTRIKFLHTPGHTKGGMCIVTDGFVFSGDTLFQASIGRTDFYGGDFDAIISSIKDKLFMLPDDTVVLPGHMGRTTIAYEKEHNPFV